MSLPPELEASLLALLARETRTPAGAIQRDTPLVSGGLLDSIGLVRVAALLEKRLGIRIPDADVTAEHFDTLARICSYAERRLSA